MARIIDGVNFLTAAEAAEELNTTITRVLMMLRSGDLLGRELDGEWCVAQDSLACAKAHGTDKKTANGCISYCASKGCGCK